ncbi:septal ring lytic transglycosylase RlpA family protein [Massilia norwichensis]|uniref:Endolytic peptidoglycan transglycosylase RlpA n=1 Tax=Massilia norwichensis TaxID=1442366 RepID=A0ABT2ACK5_9BURK|nr:septal ring lytic transglycosylase RlpA family protein [Massilia norwichensis]
MPAVIAIASAALMTGCGTTGDGEHKSLIPLPWKHKVATRHGDIDPKLPKLPKAGSGRGGYYQDDGPGDNPPPGLQDLPDALVKYEPYAKFANRPYSVFGQTYTPLLNDEPFSQRGVASWYGVKFHGQRTSSGEAYDMYKMTAAHPTLPIPSYARITSLETGKSVVVRINDRGPFHSDRIVDVSYTAALKLGLLGKGSHQVEVERLFPDDPTRIATVRRAATSAAQTAPAPSEIAALMLEDRVAMDSAAVARPDAAAKPAAVKSGFYLQLGAYGREGKAEEIGEMLKKSGVAQALEVVRSGAVNRLYSGPFETRAMAQEAMRALPSSLGLKPIVVRR